MSITKRYIDIGGKQIHVRQIGRTAEVPLVLLHQTASSGAMFESLMPLLADSFHVIAPDTPGFGASFRPANTFSVQDLSEALYTALKLLGVQICYLFGHHTGAAIAVQMAYDHPDFVRKMILSGPPLLDEAHIQSLKAGLHPFTITEDGAHLLAVWERIRRRAPSLSLDIVHREVMLTLSAGQTAQTAYHAVFEQPFAVQLAALSMPVLVMAGENDTLRTSAASAFSFVKSGALKIIPGEGSYICDQNPQAVAEVIRAFMVQDVQPGERSGSC
ncbi:alpha/beta fold hydrolase [Roseiflexus sp.]|uniref:alpha/beta fold hydrolase n=2 Tax=Roseiflexus sp. TaxID=2562120 RepID=UPI00398AA559